MNIEQGNEMKTNVIIETGNDQEEKQAAHSHHQRKFERKRTINPGTFIDQEMKRKVK